MKAILIPLTFASILAAALATPSPEARPVKVFLCAGQSNMLGIGRLEGLSPELTKEFPANDILYWWVTPFPEDNPPGSKGWTHPTRGEGGFGPDRIFALEMRKAFPNHTIAIAKASRGATALKFWLPNLQDPTKNKAGAVVLTELIAGVTADLDAQKASGKIPGWEWAGFVWQQGEAESNGPNGPRFPVTYDTDLEQLVSTVRELTKTPNLPVVLGRISSQISPRVVRETGVLRLSKSKNPDAKNALPDEAEDLDDGQRRGPIWHHDRLYAVRAAQEKYVASDPRAAWVDVDDIPLVDTYHYDTSGYAEFGRRFAKAMLPFLSTDSSTTP